MPNLNIQTLTAANDNVTIKLTGTKFLQAKQANAIAAIVNLNTTVNSLLDGCGTVGERAVLAAYDFTIACMDDLASANKLVGWANAKPQTGANPYCQPLNLLAPEKDNVIRPKKSIWAKVFRSAHKAGIAPDDFLNEVKQYGSMRRWYDEIVAAEKRAANDNEPDGQNDSQNGNEVQKKPSGKRLSRSRQLPTRSMTPVKSSLRLLIVTLWKPIH